MAEEKKKDDADTTYKALKELFSPQHKYWRGLYKDHDVAHKKGMKAVKEDTTNLDYKEILEEFGKYIQSYEEYLHGKAEGISEYRRELSRGQAAILLRHLIKEKQISVEELQREGIERLLSQYRLQKKHEDTTGLTESIIGKHVDLYDEKQVNELVGALKKYDLKLSEKKDNVIKGRFKEHLTEHFHEYHQTAYAGKPDKPAKK